MYRCKAWEVGVAGLGPVSLKDDNGGFDNDEGGSISDRIGNEKDKNDTLDDEKCDRPPKSASFHLLKHDPAWRNDIENIDVSDIVSTHLNYCECLKNVLARVGIPVPGE